jgi:putative transposase
MVTPGAKREAVAHAREHHGVSERRACALVGVSRRVIRYEPTRSDDGALRQRLRELAAERRRFGYRRLGYLLAREGITPNHKKLLRIYREEGLRVRRRGGRKRALGTRRPMVLPDGPNQRWSLDFVSDSLICGRRFRILCVVDDYTRECLALVADTSLSGVRVARELTAIIGQRGKPHTVVSDNGTELTSSAILRWSQERRSSGITSLRASQCKTASSRASMAVCGTNASTRRCSPRWLTPGSSWLLGGTITTRSGHTRNWAGRPPPRSPANVSGGMPPDTLPSHQTTIMKERDSTSEW